MNFYPFHLGDYATHTAHLEPIEDLAYRRMLDLYYRTEAPLHRSVEEVSRLVRLRDQVETIRCILSEFFILCDAGWVHERCETELAKYKAMADGGRRGAAKRWAKPGDSPPIAPPSPGYSHPNANQEPRTKNQYQETPKTKTPRKRETPCPDGVTDGTWQDWLTLRKAKRAPVTDTVVKEAAVEAKKAGLSLDAFLRVWCARGSQGLQADWLKPSERGKPETLSKWIKGTSLDPDFQGYPDDEGGFNGNVPALR